MNWLTKAHSAHTHGQIPRSKAAVSTHANIPSSPKVLPINPTTTRTVVLMSACTEFPQQALAHHSRPWMVRTRTHRDSPQLSLMHELPDQVVLLLRIDTAMY
jgi:hypothetical protein